MISGYDPVATDDSLLPQHTDRQVLRSSKTSPESHQNPQSFDYDSIFNYDAPPEEKKFQSVYKYEELSSKNCYEADYYKVVIPLSE